MVGQCVSRSEGERTVGGGGGGGDDQMAWRRISSHIDQT